MNKKLLGVTVILALFVSQAWAEPLQIIKLKDKTSIRGEVVGMNNGVYTVKSSALGNLNIPADQVIAIISEDLENTGPAPKIIEEKQGKRTRPGNVSPRTPKNQKPEEGVPELGGRDGETIQKDATQRVHSMMMNKDFSEKVTGLGENDSMQDVLNDPETMNQINSMDYEALMNNEKMKNLMESSEIKDLLGNFEE